MRGYKKKPRNGGHRTEAPKQNKNLHSESKSTATEAQIARLISRLRMRPHHTHELRKCGISHPAGRVRDLCARGFVIESDRVSTVDSDGYPHVGVALYTLVAEPGGTK